MTKPSSTEKWGKTAMTGRPVHLQFKVDGPGRLNIHNTVSQLVIN